MCNGIDFVNRIDEVLLELNISKKDLSKALDLNTSTISNWKTSNSLPSVNIVNSLAEFLEVSTDWLINGNLINQISDKYKHILSRNFIRNRVYSIIKDKLNIKDADNEETHKLFFMNLPKFSYRLFINWAKYRCNFDIYILQEVAFTLGVTLDHLLTTEKNDEQDIEKTNKKILETAQRNLNDLFCLDNLTEDRKKSASMILNQLMKLEHLEYVEKQKNNNT